MVRTRFAPSPTGFPHLGHLRTAAYAYAIARHNSGEFILRIEDTDQKRYVAEGVDSLKNMLTQFGMQWDEYFVQSERKEQGIYQCAAEKLVVDGHAFYCNCPAKNAKKEGFSSILRDPCRVKDLTSGAIKLKVPDQETVTYHDFVLDKDISWPTSTIYDATLLKEDGYPTYHLAAMVDDIDMRITHVVRGHDWMPSTPIHLLVYGYLGGPIPEIGHPTDVLSPNGGKLAKRKGSTSISDLLAQGYLPEALLNFIILLGWAPKDNREMFTLEEFVHAFDPKGFQKSNPVFHTEKLDWFNGQYIRKLQDTELTQLVKPFMKNSFTDTQITQIVPLVKDRLVKLSDFDSLTRCFFRLPEIDPAIWLNPANSNIHLTFALPVLQSSFWDLSSLQSNLSNLITQNSWKVGDFFMSLRIAVCGSRQTPPITETMLVLGKEESLSRLQKAINYLKN